MAAIERDFSLASQMLSPRHSRLEAAYVEIFMCLVSTWTSSPTVPEIPIKDVFRHLPGRLTGIDDLDNSVFPSLAETEGQLHTVELDDLRAEDTRENHVDVSWHRHMSGFQEPLSSTLLAIFPAPCCSVTRTV